MVLIVIAPRYAVRGRARYFGGGGDGLVLAQRLSEGFGKGLARLCPGDDLESEYSSTLKCHKYTPVFAVLRRQRPSCQIRRA